MRRVPAHEIIKEEGEEEKKKSSEEMFHCPSTTRLAFKSTRVLVLCDRAKKKSKWTRKPTWAQGRLSFLASDEHGVIKTQPDWQTPTPPELSLLRLDIILTSFSSSSSIRECEEWATAGPGGVKQPLMDDSVLPLNRQGSTGQVSHLGSEVAD